jgi:hypothetical protein
MKSGDPPTETDQENWKKRTSKETATAQQPRHQNLHHKARQKRERFGYLPLMGRGRTRLWAGDLLLALAY